MCHLEERPIKAMVALTSCKEKKLNLQRQGPALLGLFLHLRRTQERGSPFSFPLDPRLSASLLQRVLKSRNEEQHLPPSASKICYLKKKKRLERKGRTDEADFGLCGNTGLFLHAGLCSSPIFQGDFLRCGAQGGPGEGAHYRSAGDALRWIRQCQRPFVCRLEAFGSVWRYFAAA